MSKFVLLPEDEDRIVKWPVTIRVPKDGGRSTEFRITGHFKLITKTRIDDLSEDDYADLLHEVFVGWNDGDIVDIDGNPVPVNEDTLARMIDPIYHRVGLIAAFNAANKGSSAKN